MAMTIQPQQIQLPQKRNAAAGFVSFLRKEGFSVSISINGNDISTSIDTEATGTVGNTPVKIEWHVRYDGNVIGSCTYKGTCHNDYSFRELTEEVHKIIKSLQVKKKTNSWLKTEKMFADHCFSIADSPTRSSVMDLKIDMLYGRSHMKEDGNVFVIPTLQDFHDASKQITVATLDTAIGTVVAVIADRDPLKKLPHEVFNPWTNRLANEFKTFFGIIFVDGSMVKTARTITKFAEIFNETIAGIP